MGDTLLIVPDICAGPTTAPETVTFIGGENSTLVHWMC